MRSMHSWLVLSGAVLLSACGGDTAPQTVGSIAPPSGGGSTPTPTPTHSFVAPTDPKTYEGIGAVQHFEYFTDSDKIGQGPQLYAGDANTVRDSGISISYNPRDAIFELTISRPLGNVDVAGFRFQDPAHRTNFGGMSQPQPGTPELPAARNIQYLETSSGSGTLIAAGTPARYPVGAKDYTSTASTFFYQKPNASTTQYVTYAGFLRNTFSVTEEQPLDPADPAFLRQTYSFDRAAFVFGERSLNSAVPTTGRGTFSGEMIATLVFNPMLDVDPGYPSYLQWMYGTQTSEIKFGDLTVDTVFTGTLLAPVLDAYTTGDFLLPNGASFRAVSTARIDLINKGGFTGTFTEACFAVVCTSANEIDIAGSSIDGAFFGPAAQEIGGGFRIVGGTPDQRVDILGAFTGKKLP